MITTVPITVLADDRESAPYTFDDLGDVSVVTQRLVTGDYSLPFLVDKVAVERKSLADLYATLGTRHRRELWAMELGRMDAMPHALVVVEDLYHDAPAPPGVMMPPAWVVGQCYCLRVAYPNVRWEECEGRRAAEVATLAFLVAAMERVEREARP